MQYYAKKDLTNIIKNNTGYLGAGIRLHLSAPMIIGNEITGNEANFLGGGIFTYFSSPIIIDNIISNNKAHSSGGIHTEHYSQTIIRGNSIRGNIAEGGAGGIKLDEFSNAIIDSNMITENQAHHGGGLGMILDSHPQITNNVIANNKGGGIFVSQSYPQVTNNTIVDNTKESGNAIYIHGNSNVFVTNTILGNSEIVVDDEYSEVTITHSLGGKDAWGVPWQGEGNISQNPLFVGDGDYHLLPNSPCIDAGTDVDVSTDIEGNERPQGQGFDIGAYEYVTQD